MRIAQPSTSQVRRIRLLRRSMEITWLPAVAHVLVVSRPRTSTGTRHVPPELEKHALSGTRTIAERPFARFLMATTGLRASATTRYLLPCGPPANVEA